MDTNTAAIQNLEFLRQLIAEARQDDPYMDMLRLRSSPNKRTEACEIVNRFKKKMNDKRACNIGNLR